MYICNNLSIFNGFLLYNLAKYITKRLWKVFALIICPNCKNEIQNDNAKFCVKCGYNLSAIKLDKQINNEKNNNINNNSKNKKPTAMVAVIASCSAAGIVIILLIVLFATGIIKVDFDFGNLIGMYGDNGSSQNLLYGDNAEDDFKDDFEYELTETESETESTTEEVKKVSSYSVHFGDVTWGEAVKACQNMGGHLVTIDSEEEFNQIMSLIAPYDKKSVFFLGGWRSADSYEYYWIDNNGYQYGSALNGNSHWLPGEPTFYDQSTGTAEDCMMMYYNNDVGQWIYNDVPGNYLDFADYKSGRVAYICEIEQ